MTLYISTHTSRVGCDLWCPWFYRNTIPISTHTSRVGCDEYAAYQAGKYTISTHTSRVGCDSESLQPLLDALNFYSHIPCGM